MNTNLPMYDDPKHPHFSEFLPIIDGDGRITQIENRVETHQKLFIHPVVRGILLTPEGKVIMQQKRLKSKMLQHITVLDTTVSGHIGGTREKMEKLIGTNVFPLVVPTLQQESQEETGISLAPEELIYLGQTGLYPDMPEKTEIAYVSMFQIKRKVAELTGEEKIVFEAIDINEILQADRTGRIAWDIIGPQWAHIWEQVQKHT